MLQVFYLDVAKLDMDIVYVFAMDFKYFSGVSRRMWQVFQTYVANVFI